MQYGRWSAFALALLLAPGVKADWLQPGHDAAQTGNTPEDGPEWDDVVFELRFNVTRQSPVPPLIVGERAYVAYRHAENQTNHIVAVSLVNGTVTEFTNSTGTFVHGMASDGDQVFVLTDGGYVTSFGLADGQMRWRSPVSPTAEAFRPSLVPFRADGVTHCFYGTLLVAEGEVVAACDAHDGLLYVAGYDSSEGGMLWEHLRDGRSGAPEDNSGGNAAYVHDPYASMAAGTVLPVGTQTIPTGITRLGNVTIVADLVVEAQAEGGSTRGGVVYGEYVAIDATGALVWAEREGLGGDAFSRASGNTGSANAPPPATGDARRAFLELDAVEEWRSDNTGPYADRVIPIRAEGSVLQGDPGSGFALAAEGLYATAVSELFLIDSALVIQRAVPAPEGQEWGPGPLTRAANEQVYVTLGPRGAGFGRLHPTIQALQAGTLESVWTHRFPSDVRFAVSGGLMVAWCEDGTLTVLGRNQASPLPTVDVSSRIPGPGDLVTADLSGSGPGLFGDLTQYKADWGDGTTTEWQASPLLEHRYSSLSNFEARFSVRNAANQTASVTQTFVVGGQPDLNFLQRQFASDRQNTSFFVLGLLATLAAALWGVANIRRSHNRLARELRDLEERIEARRGVEVDEAIRAFRLRAQQLFAERKIDHGQYLVLLGRVQEVQRGLRMSVVDERLAFLPHGMVKRLEAMLGDARVTGWERHHFLEALDAESALNPQQRREVRALVDTWFAADQRKPAA